MKAKRITVLVLAAVMLMGAAACSGNASNSNSGTGTTAAQTTPKTTQAAQNDPAKTQEAQQNETGSTQRSSGEQSSQAASGNAYEVQGGTDQSSAVEIPVGTKITGRTVSYKETWYSFTTGGKAGEEYWFTMVNKTPKTDDIILRVADQTGTDLEPAESSSYDHEHRPLNVLDASDYGGPGSGMFNTLEPNTTYYIHFGGIFAESEYSLLITEGDTLTDMEARTTIAPEDVLSPAANVDTAPLIVMNEQYHCECPKGTHWVALKTGSGENTAYYFTVVNETEGIPNVEMYLQDLYGENQWPTEKTANDSYTKLISAKADGTPNTGMIDTLKPDTTYYLWIETKADCSFTLAISENSPLQGQ